MNYRFKDIFRNGRVLSVQEFRHMMSFVRQYNNVRNSGVTGEANILRELISRGFTDASAVNQVTKMITGGQIPTIQEEHEMLGEYYNYTQEVINEEKEKIQKEKEKFDTNKVFTDEDGNSYSAKELKTLGKKAKRKARGSRFARLGMVLAGALIIGPLVPAVLTSVFAGVMATSTLSTLASIGTIGGLIGGGILGKRVYDMGGRAERLRKNTSLANLYQENKDIIREQELQKEASSQRLNDLYNMFGIEVDAFGNETSTAYNDMYNAYARFSARQNMNQNAGQAYTAPRMASSQDENDPRNFYPYDENNEGLNDTVTEDENEDGEPMFAPFADDNDDNGEDSSQRTDDTSSRRTSPQPESPVRPVQLDPSFGQPLDVDRFMKDNFGEDAVSSKPAEDSDTTSRVKTGTSITEDNIDDFLADLFGADLKREEPKKEEPSIIEFDNSYVSEAEDFATRIIKRSSSSVIPDDKRYSYMQYIKTSLETVKDASKTAEERDSAFLFIKDSYIDLMHKINMATLAELEKQFDEYKKADTTFVDRDFDLLREKIQGIDNAYNSTSDLTSDDLDRRLRELEMQEGLVDIAVTYGRVVDNQQKMANPENVILSQTDKDKYTVWSAEHGKFMHIVIENAVQEDFTLEELNAMIKEDDHPDISYMACKRDAKEINDHIRRATRTVVKGESMQVENTPTEPQQEKEAEKTEEPAKEEPKAPVKGKTPAPKPTPVKKEGKPSPAPNAVKPESAKPKVKPEPPKTPEVSIEPQKTEEELKRERRKKFVQNIFEGEPTEEELREVSGVQGKTPMRAVLDELGDKAEEPIFATPNKPAQTRVSNLLIEQAQEEVEKEFAKQIKYLDAAGRYVAFATGDISAKRIGRATTIEELDERKATALGTITEISEKHQQYTNVDIVNRKNNTKVRYIREVAPEDEKHGEKMGSDIDVKSLSSYHTLAESEELYKRVISSYLRDFVSSYNGVSSVTGSEKEDAKEIRRELKAQIQARINKGEDPLTAIDGVMRSAFRSLETSVNKSNIEVIDKGFQVGEDE